jgi:hypothetical protein
MPARRDLNPADILALLPHLMIVDKVDDQFRWRLVGTAAVREVGREPTGSIVGSYGSTAESASAARAVYARVFTSAHPIFATGEFQLKSGDIHNMSLLALPLSDNGADVNMAVSTLVPRFGLGVTPSSDWLKGLPVNLRDVVDVDDAEGLEKLCLEWKRQSRSGRAAAENV